MVEIRYSKRQKPYLVCDPCGVQIFIRGKQGISLLNKWKKVFLNQNHTASETSEVLRLVDQLDKFKTSLKKVEDSQGSWATIFAENPAADAIKSEIEKTENRLRELTEKK
jgi:hypothetical protein